MRYKKTHEKIAFIMRINKGKIRENDNWSLDSNTYDLLSEFAAILVQKARQEFGISLKQEEGKQSKHKRKEVFIDWDRVYANEEVDEQFSAAPTPTKSRIKFKM